MMHRHPLIKVTHTRSDSNMNVDLTNSNEPTSPAPAETTTTWQYNAVVKCEEGTEMAIQTATKECFLCLKEFENDDDVHVLDCPGNHICCEACGDEWYQHLVANPPDVVECPVCRHELKTVLRFVAQNYYPGSGKEDDPVVIE